jgi:hypothetical protein
MLRLFMMLSLFVLTSSSAGAGEQPEATIYKRPFCSCCDGHAGHLRANGYKVTVIETENMSLIKKKYGVPQEFEGCHTIVIGGYVVEGHVPASIIDKLLKERPAIRGISLPGMPEGSPGMTGVKNGPFVVYELSDKPAKVFAKE